MHVSANYRKAALGRLACLLFLSLTTERVIAAPDISLLSRAQVSSTSGTAEHSDRVDASNASVDATGSELGRTPCGRREGRNSSGSARASVVENRRQGPVITFAMSAAADTKGGHYRSCGGCVLGRCVDIKGNDTTATAAANASATAEVRFPADAFLGDYVVSVLTSQAAATWSIVGINYLEVAQENGTRRFLIRGGPQTFFRLDFALNVSSTNVGGCCADAQQSDSTITVGVQSAGHLESMTARYGPRMVNGTLEKGFPSVGLLAIRNLVSNSSEAHCTGTLITRSTVLTAAHCVAGLSDGTLRFMLGADIRDTSSIWSDVVGWRYPQGLRDDAGLQYSASSHVDDVAVVYLREPVADSIPVFALHDGIPALRDIFEHRSKLTFVGFGQFEAGAGGRGAGVKRKLLLELKTLELRSYTNAGEGENTCKGDSGAPSFVGVSQGVSLVAGVVSRGDDACLYDGINSRVEHYIKWIKDHEKK